MASGSTVKLTVSNGEEPEGEVKYGLMNLPTSIMSGMYTINFTTDDGVLASKQFVAETLDGGSFSATVPGKGKKSVKVTVTSAQTGKTEVIGTYTFDFASKTFTASSEDIDGAFQRIAPLVTQAVTEAATAADETAGG